MYKPVNIRNVIPKKVHTEQTFPLLRRLSISSLLAMLVTATVLVLLYRQDQLTEHGEIIAQDNKESAAHLMYLLGEHVNILVTSSNELNTQSLQTNPKIGLFTDALKRVHEPNILKLKIYTQSGTCIYSDIKDEIGQVGNHSAFLSKALLGEVTFHIEFYKLFLSADGEKHDVYISETYIPITHLDKQLGTFEIYSNATPIYHRIHVNVVRIALIVFSAFAALYAALFFSVRKTDRAVAEWQKVIKHALDDLKNQKFALDQHCIVGITDVQGTITHANDWFCKISGYSREELLGQNHRILNSGIHSTEFFREMYRTIAAGKVWHGEICNRAKNGNLYWVMTTVVPFMDEFEKPTQYISMRTDVTARKKAEVEIHNLAYYDVLTNLPNRRLLSDRLSHAMATSKRSGCYGALMFMDLDNFKKLNDEHGHVVGDLLLIEVAERLKKCVREIDTVARFGGDEFVVMLNELDVDKVESTSLARSIAEKILSALSECYVRPCLRLSDLCHPENLQGI